MIEDTVHMSWEEMGALCSGIPELEIQCPAAALAGNLVCSRCGAPSEILGVSDSRADAPGLMPTL